jgi:hypothetical protein
MGWRKPMDIVIVKVVMLFVSGDTADQSGRRCDKDPNKIVGMMEL